MKLYIAGPMTGVPDFNYPAFEATAAKLRAAGFDTVSPTENGLPKTAPRKQHIRADINLLLSCGGMAMMDGWEHSNGAQLERHIAMKTGIWVMSVCEWLTSEITVLEWEKISNSLRDDTTEVECSNTAHHG